MESSSFSRRSSHRSNRSHRTALSSEIFGESSTLYLGDTRAEESSSASNHARYSEDKDSSEDESSSASSEIDDEQEEPEETETKSPPKQEKLPRQSASCILPIDVQVVDDEVEPTETTMTSAAFDLMDNNTPTASTSTSHNGNIPSSVDVDPDSLVAPMDEHHVAIVPNRSLDVDDQKKLSSTREANHRSSDEKVASSQSPTERPEPTDYNDPNDFPDAERGLLGNTHNHGRLPKRKRRASARTLGRDSVLTDPNLDSARKWEVERTSGKVSTYPKDAYSFMACFSPLQHPVLFGFGFLVFLFQVAFLMYLILSKMDKRIADNMEVDNPANDFFSEFIPANVSNLVHATRVTAVLCYVVFADASLKDCVTAVELFPRFDRTKGDEHLVPVVISCVLRFTQGFLAILATLLLIVVTDDVIEIILNFAAVNFISDLDEVAFDLARYGKYGPTLEKHARAIEQKEIPYCCYRKYSHVRYMFTVLPIAIVMIVLMILMIYAQESAKFWVTHTVRVQFQGNTGLEEYSGCYNIDKDVVHYKRHNYNSFEENPLSAALGYCKEEHQWILFKNDKSGGIIDDDPCSVTRSNELAHSGVTDYFDISSSYDQTWYSADGNPLDLYFFDSDQQGDDLVENCGSFLNNGHCDVVFNTLGFQYDGGDCCANTCTRTGCGLDGADGAFGSNQTKGQGFRHCRDPIMVPVTFFINHVQSSRNPEVLEVTEEQLEEYFREKGEDFWDVEPVTPLFSVKCDGDYVLSVYIDKTMEEQSETIMVRDGASCRVSVSNRTSNFVTWDTIPKWWVDYTIYHGNDTIDEITTSFSGDQDTIFFRRIPQCYLDELSEYIEVTTAYTANTDFTWGLDWIVNDQSGYSNCDDEYLIERFALGAINFAAPKIPPPLEDSDDGNDPVTIGPDVVGDMKNSTEPDPSIIPGMSLLNPETNLSDTFGVNATETNSSDAPGMSLLNPATNSSIADSTNFSTTSGDAESNFDVDYNYFNSIEEFDSRSLWILSKEKQCQWENIACEEGSVETFAVSSKNLYGTISTAIGLLSNLRRMDYDNNGLFGSIPTYFGVLTKLEGLDLDNNKLTGKIPTQFGNLVKMRELDLDYNQLSGSIPTEFGLMTDAREFDLKHNMLSGTIPTHIGKLTSMVTLSFVHNMLSGSIPTEFGSMKLLQRLQLAENKLTGTIPRALGNEVEMTDLWLANNNMTGQIPSFIGRLNKLTRLDLENNNFKGKIPTEIGLLTALRTLSLRGNSFTGQIPSEIGLLTELREIRLESNEFTGTIPLQITFLERLRTLTSDEKLSGSIPKDVKTLKPCVLCGEKNYELLPDNEFDAYYENGEYGVNIFSCSMLNRAKEEYPDTLMSESACAYLRQKCISCNNGGRASSMNV